MNNENMHNNMYILGHMWPQKTGEGLAPLAHRWLY